MRQFELLSPRTLEDTLSLLSKYKDRAALIAGGTDLMCLTKAGAAAPDYVVSIETVPGLDYIQFDGKLLKIGALAAIDSIENSHVIREHFPVLADAARQMGSPQIRNQATVLGNLCRASPSADMAPALLALGAMVKAVSTGKERLIDLVDFFTGPGQTALGADELLAEVQVPALSPDTRGVYLKMAGRAAVGIAQVSAAVVITFAKAGNIVDKARIVLGAVAPTAIRVKQAEDILKDKPLDDRLIAEAAKAAADAARPISDIRATSEYRREMVGVLVSRALTQIAVSLTGGSR